MPNFPLPRHFLPTKHLRASLPLKVFKCGWFDEKNYFEFFPLQGVYQSEDTKRDDVAIGNPF